MLPVSTHAGRSANSLARCSSTNSPPPGSSLACPPVHSTGVLLPPNAYLSSPIPCHRLSKLRSVLASAWRAARTGAPFPECLHPSKAHRPQHGATTAVLGPRCWGRGEPPPVPRFFV